MRAHLLCSWNYLVTFLLFSKIFKAAQIKYFYGTTFTRLGAKTRVKKIIRLLWNWNVGPKVPVIILLNFYFHKFWNEFFIFHNGYFQVEKMKFWSRSGSYFHSLSAALQDWYGSSALSFRLVLDILCIGSAWQMRITNPKNLPLGGGRGFLL